MIRRRGMSLIELLVVIAILGVLAGLVFVVFGSSIFNRQKANSVATIQTLHKVLQSQWNQVVSDAQNEKIPQAFLSANPNFSTFLNNDPKTMQIAWVKVRLREAFPVRFSDVQNSTTLFFGVPASVQKNTAIYRQRLGSVSTANNPYTESAACLLMALSNNRGGQGLTADQLNGISSDTDGDGIPELVDGWGNALLFFRFPASSSFAPLQSQFSGSGTLRDPLDPKGLVASAIFGIPLRRIQMENNFHRIVMGSGSTFYTTPVIASSAGVRLSSSMNPGEQPAFNNDDKMDSLGNGEDAKYLYSFNLRY